MSEIDLIPRRRVPLGITPDELSEQVNDLLQVKGYPLKLQSKIGFEIAQKVIGSNKTELRALQPHLVATDNSSWNDAFFICVAFLKFYHLDNTLNTVMLEIQDKQLPHEQEMIFTPKMASAYLSDLISQPQTSLKQKLQRFLHDIKYDDALQNSPLKSNHE